MTISTWIPVDVDEPVAWLHTLHMEGGQTMTRLLDHDGTDEDEPQRTGFGLPGRDYSEEYPVTAEPLYRRENAPAPQSITPPEGCPQTAISEKVATVEGQQGVGDDPVVRAERIANRMGATFKSDPPNLPRGASDEDDCAHCGASGWKKIVNEKSSDKIHPYRVRCTECGVSTAWHGDFKAADAAWRRRPAALSAPTDTKGLVDALEKIDARLCAVSGLMPKREPQAFVDALEFIEDTVSEALAQHRGSTR